MICVLTLASLVLGLLQPKVSWDLDNSGDVEYRVLTMHPPFLPPMGIGRITCYYAHGVARTDCWIIGQDSSGGELVSDPDNIRLCCRYYAPDGRRISEAAHRLALVREYAVKYSVP
jgi:hypothetical protein